VKSQQSQNISQVSADSVASADASALAHAQPTPSTGGIELATSRRWLSETVELLSSMRFAISALSIVSIASAIGTIVAQDAPPINYVNQFGAFWAEVFSTLDFFHVYNAPWFLIVMALMLVSTSLCLIRNTPKMIKDARSWREKVRDTTFPAFKHRVAFNVPAAKCDQAQMQLREFLISRGYRIKQDQAQAAHGSPTSQAESAQAKEVKWPSIVAKKGSTNRLGYIAAHLAIVVISLGGLLDSQLPLKAVAWWWDKTPLQMTTFTGEDVPESARLPVSTPSYRANALIPEGAAVDVAVITQGNGALLLDLPFELKLKEFRIDYYPTGMPKLFASDVVLTDKISGEVKNATIEVNKPLIHRGIAIYQSSFDDGGSQLKLKAHPMMGPLKTALPIELNVGQSQALRSGNDTLTLEVTGFKAINVENMGNIAGSPVPTVNPFQQHVASVLSPAINTGKTTQLRNIGPSFNYKLRDASGQAKEFHVYMLPVEIDSNRVYLAGVRNSPDEQFKYLRIPADANDNVDEFLRLRAALADPVARQLAARQFALRSAPPELVDSLNASAIRALDAVAQGGIENLGRVLEETVAESERDRAAEVVLRLLAGTFWELWQQARQRDGLPPAERNEANTQFAQLALTAVSDAQIFDAPLLVSLQDYQEVKASVFQVTRSPGQTTVYIGCLLLVLGIFAMLYVQERRIWVWISPDSSTNDGQVAIKLAATSPRMTLDFEREFSSITQVTSQIEQSHQTLETPRS
jgi:cytochrome c biogenesis protein